jgi:hypothetical protein
VNLSRAVLLIAAGVFAAHLLTIGNYGYFGDELYFIDCARRMAWGYVDLPPLIPSIAWLSAPFGYALWALRLLPALAGGATVIVAAMFARELGGNRFAQTLTALAIALAPVFLLLGSILSTSAFEPLLWTLLAYLAVRVVKGGDPRLLFVAGIVVAVGLYAKYSMVFCTLALIFALLLAGRGRVLTSPWALAGALLCVLATIPNVAWQWQNGWPMLEVLRQDALNRHPLGNGIAFESSNLAVNALLFIAMQFVYLNPLLTIVWIWGLLWLGFSREALPFRFLAIAYVLLFALMVGLTARGYYLAGYYPVLFAAGGVAIERATESLRAWRLPLVFAVAVLVALMVPFALPILPIDGLVAYGQRLGLSRPAPPDGRAHLVQPLFADEFGWEAMTRAVADAFHALPEPARADTALFADGYMYAGALNFYGPRYGLPTAISGNNTYYLWGPGTYSGARMLAVGATDYPIYRRMFGSVKQIAVYRDPRRWMIEGPLPIYLCTKPRIEPLALMWPQFKRFGL